MYTAVPATAPIRIAAVCLISALVLTSCAPTYRYSRQGHSTFVDENVAQLHVGMLPSEVVALFGQPDEQYVSSFGADVGEPWTGRAWLYFVRRDSRLLYVHRYEKCTFVFYPADGDMTLNHWELENGEPEEVQ